MNIFEAYRALEEWKCVEDIDGTVFKRIEGTILNWDFDRKKWISTSIPTFEYSPFKIVPDPSKPEPKPLTYQDAANKLFWGATIKLTPNQFHSYLAKPGNDKYEFNVLMIDLAERRGWKIEEVSDAT